MKANVFFSAFCHQGLQISRKAFEKTLFPDQMFKNILFVSSFLLPRRLLVPCEAAARSRGRPPYAKCKPLQHLLGVFFAAICRPSRIRRGNSNGVRSAADASSSRRRGGQTTPTPADGCADPRARGVPRGSSNVYLTGRALLGSNTNS